MRGTLLIFSGPSGVGKGTVVKELRRRKQEIRLSISATTRAPRPEDVEGVTYSFKTEEEFRRMIEENAFLEYACYNGRYYGTPAAPVDKLLDAGLDVVLEIDVQGALQVMAHRPDAVSVFVAAPSFAELERRLRGRGDTAQEDIRERLETARWEYSQAKQYHYIVVNDCVEHCADEVLAILTADKCKAANRNDILKEEQ